MLTKYSPSAARPSPSGSGASPGILIHPSPAAPAPRSSVDGVGQQRDLTGPLDGPGQLALMAGAVARNAPGQNLRPLRKEAAQPPRVLVVHLAHFVDAECANFAPPAAPILCHRSRPPFASCPCVRSCRNVPSASPPGAWGAR